MSSQLLNKAGRKLFEQHLNQYQPQDPLYEYYTDKRGRKKRRTRELPPGLSERDAKILKSVKRRAHYLDKGFKIAGMQFGWTFIIGVIPGAGDVADVALNYLLVVRKARQAEVPAWLIRHMLANNAVSALAGLIPFAGDIILAAYKANSRNAALLEEFLRIRGEEFLKLQAERAGGGGKQPGTNSGAIEAVPQDDAVQVKPGAGREAGEVVPGTENATRSRSLVSWFGNGHKKKQKTLEPGKGRFVEEMSSPESAGSAASGTNGTILKKRK